MIIFCCFVHSFIHSFILSFIHSWQIEMIMKSFFHLSFLLTIQILHVGALRRGCTKSKQTYSCSLTKPGFIIHPTSNNSFMQLNYLGGKKGILYMPMKMIQVSKNRKSLDQTLVAKNIGTNFMKMKRNSVGIHRGEISLHFFKN